MKLGKIVYKKESKKSPTLILRYPTKSDLKPLLKYVNKLSDERTFVTFQGEHLTLEEEKVYLDKVLENIKNKKEVKLLAVYGDNLAGVAEIKLYHKVYSHIGELGISIDKQYRSQGIGSMLLVHLLGESKKNLPNLKIVTLDVFGGNSTAKKMYEKFGFKVYGVLPKGVLHKGKYKDLIQMYKIVN